MKKKKFKILASVFYLLFSLFFLKSSVYSSEFSAAYDVSYFVEENAKTKVSKNIHLTNKTTSFYANEYTLTVNSTKIGNISGFDALGPLKTDTSQKNGLTSIHLIFNEKVVGLGKTLNFTLKYESLDIASKYGRIWEINIPKISPNEEIEQYGVSLIVPSSFGKPLSLVPLENSKCQTKAEENFQCFFWTREILTSGITAIFGSFQLFDFKLSYHLKNQDLKSAVYKIALPPDTNYQKIILKKLDPSPLNVEADGDGNWLAFFKIAPKQKLDVTATGSVVIYLDPQITENGSFAKEDYLKPQKYWEADDPLIVKKARELKNPRAIYNFVVQTLRYDFGRVKEGLERRGAKQALTNPQSAICMEFTDLFIALARAAGIPAREIDGFAMTANPSLRPLSLKEDILHAWPEYFDEEKKAWIQVDPTWEQTTGGIDYFRKLDFNHFAFVRKGLSSTYPYPAGAYKTDEMENKDVEVVFNEEKINPDLSAKTIDVKFNLPKKIIAGFPFEGTLTVKNQGSVALTSAGLSLKANSIIDNSDFKVDILPPYGAKIFNLSPKKIPLTASIQDVISAKLDNQTINFPVSVRPVWLSEFAPIIFLVLTAVFVFLLKEVFKRKGLKPK